MVKTTHLRVGDHHVTDYPCKLDIWKAGKNGMVEALATSLLRQKPFQQTVGAVKFMANG